MKEIKTTKAGKKIEAKNGTVYIDGELAGNAIETAPAWIKKKVPAAAGIIMFKKMPVVLTAEDIEKIRSTYADARLSDAAKDKLKKAARDEDINYLNANIQSDPGFNSVTDGQFKIYKD